MSANATQIQGRFFQMKEGPQKDIVHYFTMCTEKMIERGDAVEVFPNKTPDQVDGTELEAKVLGMHSKAELAEYLATQGVTVEMGKDGKPVLSMKALQALALNKPE